MVHYPGHLIIGIVALAATLAISGYTVNRHVRRKLKLSAFLLAGYVVVHLLVAAVPTLVGDADAQFRGFERLAFAAALINLFVIIVINPLRADRVPEGVPAILQDAIVIALLVLVSTFFFHDHLITTSAVGAVVVGFALQDTLGNAFAGLAIQSEKPFRVGHWIRVGDFEGRVAEVTWRATKLRTKSGNFVVVPNNVVAKEAITNFSEPVAPTRLEVEVGASDLRPPSLVKAAIREAMAQCSRVLETPAPDVLLVNFADSAITYRARFWVEDYERDEAARDQVRTAIYYAFGRHDIDIPWPITVEYQREYPEVDHSARQRERERTIGGIDLFSALSQEQRAALAASTRTKVYGDGEVIVRQHEPGESMYVVCSGRVAVMLEPDRTEVAVIERGGYFGEMSLLTGEPRTATVVARADVVLLEIDSEVFRRFGVESPTAVEQIGVAAMTRREQLNGIKAAARGSGVAEAPSTFIARMKRFLRMAP